MKDKLGGKIMKEFVGLRGKTWKKSKYTKTCIIKRKLIFEDYKNCLEATRNENEIKQLEKNEINTEVIRKYRTIMNS